jgi:iron complex outermembrane receptor protein
MGRSVGLDLTIVDFRRTSLGTAALAACVWSAPLRAQEAAPASQVDVRGARRTPAQAPKDATVAGSLVEHEELAAPGLRLADVLRGQVGVQVTEIGGVGAPATASIRGATSAQVPVYLAGVLLNDDIAGAADLSRIPLWLIDRMEIYRGNAPLEADRLGIGGAIFFEPRWPRRTEAGAGGMLGSFGARKAWGYASTGNRDAAVLAGVSAEAATNDYPFVNDQGRLLAPTGFSVSHMTNADVTTYDAWLLGRARIHRDAVVDSFVNATTRVQGVPNLALVPSREARVSFDRAIGGVRAVLPLDGDGTASLETRAALSLARAVYSDPLEELALLARRVELAGARVDERVALRAEVSQSLEARVAADVSSETLGRDEDGKADLRARRLSSRVAAAARKWVGEALSVQALAAAQCDGTSVTTTSTCDTFAPVGRAGIAWTEPTWQAFTNVGRYVRVPSLGELYGISVVVRGYPALRPESGISADIGARWAARTLGETRAPWAALGAFARWTSDLISFVHSPQGYATPRNVASARVAGIEGQAGMGFLRWFSIDVSGTLLDPRDTTAGRLAVNDILPFQSRLVLVPRLSAESRRIGLYPIGRVRVEIRWVYQASRYADTAGLAVIPSQSSLDAELLAQTSNEVWTARFRASDLFDQPLFDVVGFPLPGRSLFLSLEAQW